MQNLPVLTNTTKKEYAFFERYYSNGRVKSEAYRFAYDTKNMKDTSVSVEASRLFKNPKFTLLKEWYEKQHREAAAKGIAYTKTESFSALCMAQEKALERKKVVKGKWSGVTEYNDPDIGAFNRAEELKLKLTGILEDNTVFNNNISLFENQLEQKAASL